MIGRLILALAAAGSLWSAAADAQPLSLGKNLGGEICRAGSGADIAQPVDIFCGDSLQSAGRLEITALAADLPADKPARREALLERSKALVASFSAEEQLSCDTGQFLGDSDILLHLCAMRSTSWPQLLLISGSGRSMVQARGMPSMLPVLAMALSGPLGRKVEPGELAAGEQLLATLVPSDVLKATTAEFARYSQSIETARVYSSRGDFATAETLLRAILEASTEMFGADSMPVGQTLAELGMQVSNQGRFDEAAGLFRRAQTIVEASLNADARAQLDSYLALDAANQRDFTKALTYARQSTAERRAQLKAAGTAGEANGDFAGLPAASSGELAHSLRIEAEMALRLDDLPNAQAAAEEAQWIINLEPGLALWWRADMVSLMGEINERRGRVAAAERNYLDAISLRQKMFGDSAPLAQSHLKIGRFYSEQQLYPQAIEHFRLAMAILVRSSIARARVVPDQITPFLDAASGISVSAEQRAVLDAEIFRAVQLVSADLAGQAITRASARVAAADPNLAALVREFQDEQRLRDQLRIGIAAEVAKSSDERSAELESALTQKLTQSAIRVDALFSRVQREFPDYVRLASPAPGDLSDLRRELGAGSAFLSYIVGFRASYGLLVTDGAVTVRRLQISSDTVASDIAALRRGLTPRLGQLPEFSAGDSYRLYTKLLAPFADQLRDIHHLVVAPGPALASLPFGLLVSAPPAEGGAYGDAAWLVRRMAVSQVPNANAFLALRQSERRHQAAPRPFLGLGDPLLSGAGEQGRAALETLAVTCRQAAPMPASLLRGLSALPDTAVEVRSVAQALGGDPGSALLGAAATETALRARPLDQYRVLYFATHGLLPGELHCQAEPGLVLSPPAAAVTTTDDDGLLEAGEVATLKLNADLVVLSACNTAASGSGRLSGGALEGLAEAFFTAGARGVIASHWEVPSEATAKLMIGLFRRYGANRRLGFAEAMRQSQLDLIGNSQTAHPYYWAAFALMGDGSADRSGGNTLTLNQTTEAPR